METPQGSQTLTCNYLHVCTGYYDYQNGYMPEFPEVERYRGQLIHPQAWPDNFDCTGKRILIIGSGATAISLAPELAKQAARVTLLQRSPTYVINLTRTDKLARKLRRWLPKAISYRTTRFKNILLGMLSYGYSKKNPERVRHMLQKLAQQQLGDKVDASVHFNPRYNPWDQRLCVAPDGDLFEILKNGQAEIVTDHIAHFTEHGIETATGKQLDADVIISATGLNIKLFGGMKVSVDNVEVRPAERFVYKSMMHNGVPNMSFAFGYTNASWTLKCDLEAKQVCQVLKHMERHHYSVCFPKVSRTLQPLAMVGLTSGYVERSQAIMPKQAGKKPWNVSQNYIADFLQTSVNNPADDAICYLQNASDFNPAAYEVERANLQASLTSR